MVTIDELNMPVQHQNSPVQVLVESVKVLLIFFNVVIVIICIIVALVIGLLKAPVFEWQNHQNNGYLILVIISLLILYSCNHLIAIYGIYRYLIKHIVVTTVITTICVIILIFKLSTNLFIIIILNTIFSVIYSVLIMNNLHVPAVVNHQASLLNNEVTQQVPNRLYHIRNSVQFADHIQSDFSTDIWK